MKKVIMQADGHLEVPKVKEGALMGHLYPVPKGYNPIVKKPNLWDDAVMAQAVKRLVAGVWKIATNYRSDYCLCISTSKLIEWYRKQIAIKAAEIEHCQKSIKVLLDEEV